jgi:hypothetical protein
MRLTAQQSYELLAKHGCYIKEVCDRCGKGIGPVCYTRAGDSGVWCSRKCRGGANAREPRTCKHCKAKLPEGKRRGTAFCDDACRKASRRDEGIQDSKLSRTKQSIYAGFCSIPKPPCYGGSQKPQNGIMADKQAPKVAERLVN